MRLTTRGRYAVTAMVDLTLHAGDGSVALADIASRNRISPAYLEQLLAALRRQGLVESSRGPGGGYRLARSSQLITVASVIAGVNESMDATRCGGSRDCHDGGRCLTHDLWQDLTQHIRDFLEGITLAELCARRHQTKAATAGGIMPLRRVQGTSQFSLAAK